MLVACLPSTSPRPLVHSLSSFFFSSSSKDNHETEFNVNINHSPGSETKTTKYNVFERFSNLPHRKKTASLHSKTEPDKPITLRILEMFRIGPGPSSSHTVGPMEISHQFRRNCLSSNIYPDSVHVELRGSLAMTGKGHSTDRAALAGLCGWSPEFVDSHSLRNLTPFIDKYGFDPGIPWSKDYHLPFLHENIEIPDNIHRVKLNLKNIFFNRKKNFLKEDLPHPNTMVLRAFDKNGLVLGEETAVSIGGGFVKFISSTLPHDSFSPFYSDVHPQLAVESTMTSIENPPLYNFHNTETLLHHARKLGSIGKVILENELAWQTEKGALFAGLDTVFSTMRKSVARGINSKESILSGGLDLPIRAPFLYQKVVAGKIPTNYVSLARAQSYAYAINEENANGGIVVCAPTMGAAGIVPAILIEAYDRLSLSKQDVYEALATAAAIAMIIKTNATLSGAEGGCMAEIGSATAMAAGMLCQIMGGDPDRVEMAAEIGLEHSLGLTCDPLLGLVQAPCIERNAIGVSKAVSAANLAYYSTGEHIISLDKCIHAMKLAGDDLSSKYKETSTGGLALVSQNIPEC